MYEAFRNSDERPSNIVGDYVGGHKIEGDYAGRDINKNTISVTGDHAVIGNENTVTTSIQNINPVFKNSIDNFFKIINDHLKDIQVSDTQKKALEENIKELYKKVEGVNPDETVSGEKKQGISETIKKIAYGLFEISPQIAETIASMTPLFPVSMAIGKSVSYFKDLIMHKKSEP